MSHLISNWDQQVEAWFHGFAPGSASLRGAAPGDGLGWRGAAVFGIFPAMSMSHELQKHYGLLLGIGSPWEVKAVELKLADKKVEIEPGWQWGSAAKCPECGRECWLHDSAPERTWRPLDKLQFETLLRARRPRSECPEHGVKTMTVPWAAPPLSFRRCP